MRMSYTVRPSSVTVLPSVAPVSFRLRPHLDPGYDTHSGKICQYRRTSVAEKRERQSDDRREAETHTDVFYRLEKHHPRDADAYEKPESII